MTPIIIWIALAMIISCFALGFLYNDVFLYAASVLCIIFGLVFIVDGIDIKTGELSTEYLDADNTTIQSKEYEYTKFDALITNGVGIIFVLLGVAFTYFEKRGRNTGKDQWGQDGQWL